MGAPDWLTHLPELAMIPLTALVIYVTVILFVRLNGLRSFSTMSAFDFAITVATGSLIATTMLNPRPSAVEGVLGLASLFLLQRIASFMRRSRLARRLIDNQPRILVWHGEVRDDNLRSCHMTREDLRAKVREAGMGRWEDVDVAVMETTGRVSIIPRRDDVSVDDEMFREARP